MRHVLAGIVASVLVVPTAQQSRSLDERIERFNIPNPLPPCGIDEPLMRLAQNAHLLIGFESKPGCTRNPIGAPAVHGAEELTDVSAREILDSLVALDSAYQWREWITSPSSVLQQRGMILPTRSTSPRTASFSPMGA